MLRRPETNRVVRRDSSNHSDHSRSGVIRFGGPVHRRPAVKVHKHVYVSSHYSHYWPWWHRLWVQPPFYGYAYPSVVVVRQPSVIVRDYSYNDPYYDSGEAYHGSDYYEPAQEVYYDSSPSTVSSSVSFYGSPPATTTDITYVDQPLLYPA
ncbi:MAG: hypothetical protein IID32_08745, partial [Planctomycetes bacterium]|nr:hypothetical protein [Planctomycetota bacterium]